MTSERSFRQLDARALRALAHPLRVQLLDLLTEDGPATATGLGKRLGESSGTTSWHLRQLAEAGLVAEDPGHGSKRERWWKAAQQATTLKASEFVDDPELAGPVASYMHEVVRQRYREETRFIDGIPQLDRSWLLGSMLNDTGLSLTPEESKQLLEELEAVIESYRRDPRPGDATVLAHWAVFPRAPRRGTEEED